ncbi:hypothetical protein CHS0354_031940 [Potamilus streckersoni]|uniref:Uncharacterized protein n=1 Tax=Potamilus streckersoni TaxID=2493646 RepID=A0AAE0VNA0_9BIVA|nr:hypothetical protein CHS0354_031940 [Potamilus streckersoni]
MNMDSINLFVASKINRGRDVKLAIHQNLVPDMNCTIYRQYQELYHLDDFVSCLRAVDIWEPLDELLRKQSSTHDCVESIIKTMASMFPQSLQKQCRCTPSLFHLYSPLTHYTLSPSLVGRRSSNEDVHYCLTRDLSFKGLFERFYVHENPHHPNAIVYYGHSLSHHHIWSLLSNVHHLQCRDLLITNLANTYRNLQGQVTYVCSPEHHTHIVPSSTTVSHVTTPTLITHSTSSASTTAQSASCDKSQMIYGIEHGVILSPSLNCPSKVFHSEQVIMSYCITSRITMIWKPGPKVVDMCQSISNYTAVGTFNSGMFDPLRDIAGVFVGCTGTSTGFRAAIALCNAPVSIVDVNEENAPFFHSPDS